MLGKQEVRKLREVLYSKSFPGKTQFIYLLTPDRDPQQIQVQVPSKSTLVNQ